MLDLIKILVDGGLLSAAFLLIVYLIARVAPRLFLNPNDVPADILAAVPPRTEKERQLGSLAAIPLMLILVAGTIYSTFTYYVQSSAGFFFLFLHAFFILIMISASDLFLMDWLILNTLTPKWVIFPGTEGLAGYKDYGFHGRAHLKALPLLILGGLIAAGSTLLISSLL